MREKVTHIWIILPLLLLCIGFGTKQNASFSESKTSISAEILNTKKQYIAGEMIVLNGVINTKRTTNQNEVFLQLSTSYGIVVLSSATVEKNLAFTLPSFISKKTGWIQWTLLVQGEVLDAGNFEILPNSAFNEIAETYIGPPSIVAGGKDFTMLVAAATDIHDNLLPNNTAVTINEQQGATTNSHPLKIKNRIAWKRIFSPEKKGRLFASILLKESTSRELSVDVFANQPQDFTISHEQLHPFADGNQILKLSTSILKDQYDNIVTDGTLVQFIGVDSNEQIFRTSATTINGIAIAKLLYPNKPTIWKIKASIPGIATSQEIVINFDSILKEFELQFSDENRTIDVGPLKSYLGQLIPDGALVVLSVVGTSQNLEVYSKDGFASFTISEDFYPADTYDITITALGISKRITKIIH